MMKNDDDNTRV